VLLSNQYTLVNLDDLEGSDTPDAIRQRDAIFYFLKVEKTANESKF
jgi:hypothetical protein